MIRSKHHPIPRTAAKPRTRRDPRGAIDPAKETLDVIRDRSSMGTIDGIGDRWSLLIVRDAFGGLRLSRQFQQSLNAPASVVLDRLNGLVERGILEARSLPDTADEEYHLTGKGRELGPILDALAGWGRNHLDAPATMALADHQKHLPGAPAANRPAKRGDN